MSSSFSFSISASLLSTCEDTEIYSPNAMDIAPPITVAAAIAIVEVEDVAPAMPTTVAATDTMPSLAPSTAARRRLSFSWYPLLVCGSYS